MKAVEKVELEGAENEALLGMFARALRGEYQGRWDSMSMDERTVFLGNFQSKIEAHAKEAFRIGVEYGKRKGLESARGEHE